MTQARLDALVAFGLACVLALWLTPLAARLATRIGLVITAARPGGCIRARFRSAAASPCSSPWRCPCCC